MNVEEMFFVLGLLLIETYLAYKLGYNVGAYKGILEYIKKEFEEEKQSLSKRESSVGSGKK